MVVYRTGTMGGEVTIKLLPGTRMAVAIQQRMAKIVSEDALYIWNGYIVDSASGFTWYLENGVLTKGPLGQTIGMGDASNKMFTFEFEHIRQTHSLKTLNNAPDATFTPVGMTEPDSVDDSDIGE